MDSLIAIICVCFALPMLISMVLIDKKSKLVIGFIIIGAIVCVIASKVNGTLRDISKQDYYYITTNLTPISEEILKAIPILVFAFMFSSKRETLLTITLATGIGFAVVENMQIFVYNGASYGIFWAVKRVFGASLMHGLCTSMVGYGISFVKTRKKLFYTGTFALLFSAMTYHSVFNSLVQSDFADLGIMLPIVTYIPIVLYFYKKKKNELLE